MLKVPMRLMVMARVKSFEAVRAVAAGDALAGGDAGAVDEAMERAEFFFCGFDGAEAVGFAGDIGGDEAGGGAEFAGECFACGIDVCENDGAATLDDHARCCLTQARGCAGDDECFVR